MAIRITNTRIMLQIDSHNLILFMSNCVFYKVEKPYVRICFRNDVHTYSKRGKIPGYKIQRQTAKCNGQNQTLSVTFSHCKYYLQQKTHENYFFQQLCNYTTCTPEINIITRHKNREKERERERKKLRGREGGKEKRKESKREKEGVREEGLKKEDREIEKERGKKERERESERKKRRRESEKREKMKN